MGRWADQWLGERLGDATREEVLAALRSHHMGTVYVVVEGPDGETLLRVRGSLVGSDRAAEWETTESFGVMGPGVDPQNWEVKEELRQPILRDVAPAAVLPTIPEEGIEQYVGSNADATGYRFDLGGGSKLAIVLWQDLLHETPSGDVAPGMPR